MARLEVLKTYKIFIGGKFPRTESGRYYSPRDKKGNLLANVCLCSRKDLRESVVAARSAFGGWSTRSAFNRSQILYRIAEMMEGRRTQFIDELIKQGATASAAKKEVDLAVDRLVYYSGWCDKFQQVFSSVNPVNSSHFNFSVPEPTGVVGLLADEKTSLAGLVSGIAALVAGGNTVIALASESKPLCAVTFSEVIATSDVPGGVINILTGSKKELLEHFGSHMDINAVVYQGNSNEELSQLRSLASNNVKRISSYDKDWMDTAQQDPYFIMDAQEIKTTWHPIENIGSEGSGY
ncbi:MAG TPA: aldehyde dehydrogenase family protein [Flavobacteriales bacterium]|nr:aldehyde dehydrogenase [Flavobacteriales bacterium]HRE73415.1 aldehyde dehydrogenase family protein [Flavobacteriales bacterium]HRE96735.1 aldehyde dehydrogenase family protein [Flavobacteriales bacterium]HRJ36260.1 aldehyde dehydrogenase family protein [Flavobacteriales bacterium]HRJ38864.1 aldehyde dehydrogenase family protein [Flavobacteriales bacterium]